MRIPVVLLILPIIILTWAARAIDGFLVERYPNLVPESKRWMLAAGAQGQEQAAGRAQEAPVQAQAAAGAQQAAYGYSQPGVYQPGAQPGAHRPDAYPPGGGAPVPYGYPQPGAAQQADYQQAGAHPQDSQPGAHRPGANAPSDYGSYGTTPPATGYGYGAPS